MQLQRFTPENDNAKRMAQSCILRLPFDQLSKRTRRLVQYSDPLVAQLFVELLGGARQQVRHNDQAASIQQRSPYLPDGKIECNGVEECPHISFVEIKPTFRR